MTRAMAAMRGVRKVHWAVRSVHYSAPVVSAVSTGLSTLSLARASYRKEKSLFFLFTSRAQGTLRTLGLILKRCMGLAFFGQIPGQFGRAAAPYCRPDPPHTARQPRRFAAVRRRPRPWPPGRKKRARWPPVRGGMGLVCDVGNVPAPPALGPSGPRLHRPSC